MPQHFGDPSNPCEQVNRSKTMVDTITEDVRSRVISGALPGVGIEDSLRDFKHEVEQEVGQTCIDLCPKYGRCILANFGNNDPLLYKSDLNEDEQRELTAKIFLGGITMMSREAMGIM